MQETERHLTHMSIISQLTPRRTVMAASALAVAALALTACSDDSAGISGAGSTAQQKAMAHFATVLQDNGGPVLDYTPSGSGDGIASFIAKDVDFAGSDSALNSDQSAKAKERCGGNDAWHLPLVAGPVAIAYNLDGVDDLTLNADILAKIFSGQISQWDDPAIVALNPGVNLAGKGKIDPVYRSDGSGTSQNFSQFLKVAAPAAWPHEPEKIWPEQVGTPASGSTKVAETLNAAPGSISYVEWGFAKEKGLGVAALDFGAGSTPLTAETASAGVNAAVFADPGSKDLVVDSDALFATQEAGVYPLVMTTYSIVCSAGYENGDTSGNLKKAFTTILDKGQDGVADLGYAPLPEEFKAKLRESIDAL